MSIWGIIRLTRQLIMVTMLLSARLLQPKSVGLVLGGYHRISYKDWTNWMNSYEKCSPTKNKNLAPININTAAVILDKNSTLMVYPSHPTNHYELKTFSTFPIPEDRNSTRIQLSTAFDTERTFIEGLGSTERRYFKTLSLLFSKSDLGPKWSLHQLDEKTVPLEIIFTFESQSSENSVLETTYIHVQVRIGESDNPMLFPVIEAIINYKEVQKKIISMQDEITKKKRFLQKMNSELADLLQRNDDLTAKGTLSSAEAKELKQGKKQLVARQNMRKKLIQQMKDMKARIQTTSDAKFLTAFQESWLFPNVGGFYMYKSYEVFPFCRLQEQSVPIYVMEDPIEISQAQLDILYDIPLPRESNMVVQNDERIDHCIPPIRPLNDRPIYYNPKNIQYFYDDHVHMISIVRKRLKEARKLENKGSSYHCRFELIFATFVIHFTILFL